MNSEDEKALKTSTVDEEQIKIITGNIRKYSANLDTIRKRADEIWKSCEMYLDSSVINSIQTVKEVNRKRYSKAFEELDNYANKMDTVANIWKEAEDEIKVSSINLENMFTDISKIFIDIGNKN